MSHQPILALIDNILAKRMFLTADQGQMLRINNRAKYNLLHSIYFDQQISHLLFQLYSQVDIYQSEAWSQALLTRLSQILEDEQFPA
jgi:hypothetical protein